MYRAERKILMADKKDGRGSPPVLNRSAYQTPSRMSLRPL